ncbi:MAG: DUF29 domain-containing protein [Gomphosphaeria aponina SAG 52.96 = DSM 107014]|uniref:DUF29 domain-containing protein n=1 Tax=Gomphosphaeria aponina SAG 52.96 = DSM 107014 TaxID=1521640 RepID=A0A941GWJ1_9CHRO|nr:DUF29 domain-containing protein [Gomphosphaeria aponina SAG 52.96 = DSM 107014]
MNNQLLKTSASLNSLLYEQDYYLWLENTVKLLREGNLSELDTANLLAEIEAMSRNEKRALTSNLLVILVHLLKYKYQPEKPSRSWRSSLLEHRRRLRDSLADSPSLKPYFQEVFNLCYKDSRKQAAVETGLFLDTFPPAPPFTFDEVLNPDYLPD